ncbi:MAG: cyclase family protein [Chloroflexota bacterium]|nr:cyclase family protein [Chloroflexia bacterium]MDQ3226799.1 cyclase family protein [Chloroflexota bacterium]
MNALRVYDLTQPLTPGIPRFPGDPEVRIEPVHDFAPWQISTLAMGTHSGTHMDAPRHRFPDGAGIGDFGPDRLIGQGLIIDALEFAANEAMTESILDAARDRLWPGWFALIRTSWDQYWGDERYFRHPYLSGQLADALVKTQASLVAIDTLSIDSSADAGSAAHEILLGAGILVAENLCQLNALDPARRYTCACLPLALGTADGSPARIMAWDDAECP